MTVVQAVRNMFSRACCVESAPSVAVRSAVLGVFG